jgi:amidase
MTMDDLAVATIAGLRRRIDTGAASVREIADAHLARIAAHDGKTNAVIELNPDVHAEADRLDRMRREGRGGGPLFGIPVMLKDNIDTGDRMTTTAGSLALEGSRARTDSHVARKLRAAGALFLGKTNLSEWANFRSTRSSSGWSSRGGQVRNAYALDRTPGGSSSGSGVAVSAGYCAVAVGTETDGSIVSPAAMNGIVGIKPTVGLVGRTGIIPIAESQDTAGPMARTVTDAAALLGAMAGTDHDDPATADAETRRAADYTAFLDPAALRGARIGVVCNYAGYHERVDAVFADALAAMRDAGAEIVDGLELPPMTEIRPHELLVFRTEIKAGLNAYLAGLGPSTPVRTLDDIIAFNRANRDRVMPWFQQEHLEAAAASAGLDDEGYRLARTTCLKLARAGGIDKLLCAARVDALVAPTTSAPWLIDWVNGDNRLGGSAGPAAVAGYPSITVPAGMVSGLPVGVSFFAGAWAEPRLIALAYAFEQATMVRRPPAFLATAAFAEA